jgi:hypothetical protein
MPGVSERTGIGPGQTPSTETNGQSSTGDFTRLSTLILRSNVLFTAASGGRSVNAGCLLVSLEQGTATN